jgi:periplasmic protein TonB
MKRLFRFREALSAANALLLMVAMLLLFHPIAHPSKHPAANFPPIELTLVAPEIQPPQPETPVAQPSPTAGPKVPRSVAQITDQPIAIPETGSAGAAPTVPVARASPALPAPVVAAPVAVPPSPPINSGREAEAVYAGKVRAYLQSIKRYPTGREASLKRPSGTASIWFIVRRNGELADAGVEASSASMLLDSTALTTVRRGAYPAFPDEAWAGKAQQRFTVELDFVPK